MGPISGRAALGLALLGLAGARAAGAAAIQMDGGAAYEDYSFAVPGRTQWAQVLVSPSARWSVLGAQTLVRRFGITQGQGTVGGIARFSPRSALETRLGISPKALLLPALALRGLWYQGLDRGFTLNPGYSFSRYEEASVHTATLGLDWERGGMVATGRAYGTLIHFPSGAPTRLTPGLLAQLQIPLARSAHGIPFYAYREESFQAGAPGAFASALFKAHAAGLALLLEPHPGVLVRLSWQYEGRIPSAYLRQYEIGLSYHPAAP